MSVSNFPKALIVFKMTNIKLKAAQNYKYLNKQFADTFHSTPLHNNTPEKKGNIFPHFSFIHIYNSTLANYVVFDNNHKFSDDLCYSRK